jgi:hypothetical protein
MKKAFVIDGGAGRVLCAIPALEHYVTNTDSEAIIIAHGWLDLYLSSKILRDKVYPANTPNLMNILSDYEVVTPEPYRLNAYFTQKCNLIQAFDILINHSDDLQTIPDTKGFEFDLGRANFVFGYKLIDQARHTFKKEKTVVIQPFGSTAVIEGPFVLDGSGRSFEVNDIIRIVQALAKNYNVILMCNIKTPAFNNLPALMPDDISLPQWAGIINAADYFIGCDSVGQHLAYILNKPATVVIGATYPENISYTKKYNFKVYDNGNTARKYSPLRITQSTLEDRNNENLMVLLPETVNLIVSDIESILGKNKYNNNECCTQEGCNA